jgi:hypothetical protein
MGVEPFVVLSGFALATLALFVTAVLETKLLPRPNGPERAGVR